jgi:hypothetical protein
MVKMVKVGRCKAYSQLLANQHQVKHVNRAVGRSMTVVAGNEAAGTRSSIVSRHLFAYGASSILIDADARPANEVIEHQPPNLNR